MSDSDGPDNPITEQPEVAKPPYDESAEVNNDVELNYKNAYEKITLLKRILETAHKHKVDPEDFLKKFEFFPELDSILRRVSSLQDDFTGKADAETLNLSPDGEYFALPEAIAKLDELKSALKEEQEDSSPRDVIEGNYASIFPVVETIFIAIDNNLEEKITQSLNEMTGNTGQTMREQVQAQMRDAGEVGPVPEDVAIAKMQAGKEKFERRKDLLASLVPKLKEMANEFRGNKETFGKGGDIFIETEGHQDGPVLTVTMGLEGLGNDGGMWKEHARLRIVGRGGREIFGIKEQRHVRAAGGITADSFSWKWKDEDSALVTSGIKNKTKTDKNNYVHGATEQEIYDIVQSRFVQSLKNAKRVYEERVDDKKSSRKTAALWAGGAIVLAGWALDIPGKVQDGWESIKNWGESTINEIRYGDEFGKQSLIETPSGDIYWVVPQDEGNTPEA